MEDAASEISDWEVLSAASACGGGEDDNEVIVVSGGGGDVLHDHFALVPSSPEAESPGEGPWSGPGDGFCEEDQILDGFDSIPRASFDLAPGVSSVQLQVGGVDQTREASVLEAAVECGATWNAEGRQAETVDAEIEQESNAVVNRGELGSVLQPAHQAVGETLGSDATAPTDAYPHSEESESLDGSDATATTDASAHSEESESSRIQLDDGEIDAGVESSCLEDVVASDGIHGGQEVQEQGSIANAASSCDEPDGALPLAHTPGTEEGDKQVVVWRRLPFRLLHYCAWKVKPMWSFSIAAALLGLVVLGRRMYRMKRKARGMPQIKIAFDDKRTSQFADRAARLNEAFLVARRVPLLRTSSGAVLPWSMVQER